MALIKKHKEQHIEAFPTFYVLDEGIEYYRSSENFDQKNYAIEEIVEFDGGPAFLVDEMKHDETPKEIASRIASVISKLDAKRAPIEKVMELLKLHNAYVRNLGISILRDFGDAIRYYIVKFLIGDDRDLRIFAINVLGDVNFAASRDMLIELLENEYDLNVAMTAVDYMAEIGEEEDIELLERVKERFSNDTYASFAVDGAVRSIRG